MRHLDIMLYEYGNKIITILTEKDITVSDHNILIVPSKMQCYMNMVSINSTIILSL